VYLDNGDSTGFARWATQPHCSLIANSQHGVIQRLYFVAVYGGIGGNGTNTDAIVTKEASHVAGESIESWGFKRTRRIATEDERSSSTGNQTLDGPLQGRDRYRSAS
jgi:hypothetical protein